MKRRLEKLLEIYSKNTYSKVRYATPIIATVNDIIKDKGEEIPANPFIAICIAFIVDVMIGNITGKRIIGNKSSLALDFMIRYDKELLTITKEIFPAVSEIKNIAGFAICILSSKKIRKMGNIINSIRSIITKLKMILPNNMLRGLMGANLSPSIVSSSISLKKALEYPSIPTNKKTSHNNGAKRSLLNF